MMFFTTPDPVLIVQESRMSGIDPQNPASLFGMWSVFSKASGILEHGRRFENLSWRLWMKQRLCEKNRRHREPSATSRPRQIASRDDEDLPALSRSFDSQSSYTSTSSMSESTPSQHSSLQSSPPSSLGREKKITKTDLKNLVISIKSTQSLDGPLSPLPIPPPPQKKPEPQTSSNSTRRRSAPRPASPLPVRLESSASTIQSNATDATQASPASTSGTSQGSTASDHSVVRGFAPGKSIAAIKPQSQLEPSPVLTPILKTSSSYCKPASVKKKVGLFKIGSGSSEGSGTLQENISPRSFKGESKDDKRPSIGRKITSFKEEVTEIPKAPSARRGFFLDEERDDGAAIESDSEDEQDEDSEEDDDDDGEISESAIEDDEDAWTDDGETDDGAAELTFRRIDSKPDLVSRRSLLTLNLHGRTAQGSGLKPSISSPLLHRARTSQHNGPSIPASPDEDSPLREQNNQSGKATFAVPPQQSHFPIMSPRDTRRTMLTQELGVSLRKHMLNERQQRNFFSNSANLPRRAQTSLDMRQLANQNGQAESSLSQNNRDSADGTPNDAWADYERGAFNNSGW